MRATVSSTASDSIHPLHSTHCYFTITIAVETAVAPNVANASNAADVVGVVIVVTDITINVAAAAAAAQIKIYAHAVVSVGVTADEATVCSSGGCSSGGR